MLVDLSTFVPKHDEIILLRLDKPQNEQTINKWKQQFPNNNIIILDKSVDVNIMRVELDDVILISLDYSSIPLKPRTQIIENIKSTIKEVFPDNMIIVKDKNALIEIEKETEK